jgi:hypothetical protein
VVIILELNEVMLFFAAWKKIIQLFLVTSGILHFLIFVGGLSFFFSLFA